MYITTSAREVCKQNIKVIMRMKNKQTKRLKIVMNHALKSGGYQPF